MWLNSRFFGSLASATMQSPPKLDFSDKGPHSCSKAQPRCNRLRQLHQALGVLSRAFGLDQKVNAKFKRSCRSATASRNERQSARIGDGRPRPFRHPSRERRRRARARREEVSEDRDHQTAKQSTISRHSEFTIQPATISTCRSRAWQTAPKSMKPADGSRSDVSAILHFVQSSRTDWLSFIPTYLNCRLATRRLETEVMRSRTDS